MYATGKNLVQKACLILSGTYNANHTRTSKNSDKLATKYLLMYKLVVSKYLHYYT